MHSHCFTRHEWSDKILTEKYLAVSAILMGNNYLQKPCAIGHEVKVTVFLVFTPSI
jgi:hypothetical protein